MEGRKKIFVIEHCENCPTHQWCTRHDEKQYKNYAIAVAAAIKEQVKNCEVVFNLVPKENAMSDIYCQLIPNDEPSQPFYEVVPRIGAFELSFNGVLLFSKMLSKMWPNALSIAQKCERVIEAVDQGADLMQFQTTGQCFRQPRKSGNKEGGQVYQQPPPQQQMPQAGVPPEVQPEAQAQDVEEPEQVQAPVVEEQQPPAQVAAAEPEPVVQQEAAPVQQEAAPVQQEAAPVETAAETKPAEAAPAEQQPAAEAAPAEGQ